MKNKLSNSILDAIGNTPMLEVEGIYCKLEYLNPSGSIKARIAKYMVERAEDEGLLKEGDTIVEATSGNSGNSPATSARPNSRASGTSRRTGSGSGRRH